MSLHTFFEDNTFFNLALSVSVGAFFKESVSSLMYDLVYPLLTHPLVMTNVRVGKFSKTMIDLAMAIVLSFGLFQVVTGVIRTANDVEEAVMKKLCHEGKDAIMNE